MSPEGRAFLLEMLSKPAPPMPHGPPRPGIIPTWTDGEPDNLAAAVADAVEWMGHVTPPNGQSDRLARCRDALVRLAHEAIRGSE